MTNNDIPLLVSWSGGKDSALALNEIMKSHTGPIELFTTLNMANSRVAMHGISSGLLEQQALSLGLLLRKIFIPDPCSNEDYSSIMQSFLESRRSEGVDTVVFGDLFLEDIRQYREQNLAKLQMNALFPLWQQPTANVALEFIRRGFKAIITCVDTRVMPHSFSGREYNLDFLGDLPPGVDPCGENGEFHSFVYDGPGFRSPVCCKTGEQLLRYDRFFYTDLVPV